jgi:Transposase C of IS166 homeodomain
MRPVDCIESARGVAADVISLLRMQTATESLPEDANALKAMLIAERVQNERLRQIIKELQRHRFERRTEILPEDQMLLGLEDVEQTQTDVNAATEQSAPIERAARITDRRIASMSCDKRHVHARRMASSPAGPSQQPTIGGGAAQR